MTIGEVKGLVVFVTGGASGLGEATVVRLVKRGAKVAIFDLPTSKGSELAEQLGDNCIFSAGDVTSEVDVVNALEQVKSKFQRLDVVVNSAGIGIFGQVYNFESDEPHSLEGFQRIINVNTVGTFNVCRLAVGLMINNDPNEDGQRGVIVNMASIAGLDGPINLLAYVASKAAVAGMTLSMARELSTKGIRVCSISPGTFDTPMVRSIPAEQLNFVSSPKLQFPNRPGHPDELAHMVQSIIENPQLNGENIRLDSCYRA